MVELLFGFFALLTVMLGIRTRLPRKLGPSTRLLLASFAGLLVAVGSGYVGAIAAWVILPPSQSAECGINWPCGDPRPPTMEELLLLGAVLVAVMALPGWVPLTLATDLPGWFTLGVAVLVNTVTSVVLITGYDYYADPDYDMRHFYASLAIWVAAPLSSNCLQPLLESPDPDEAADPA